MFGIVSMFANAIGLGISKIRMDYENSLSKGRGYERINNGENKERTYIDSKGQERDLQTNAPMIRYRKNGNIYLMNLKTKQEINLTAEFLDEKWRRKVAESSEDVVAVYYTRWNITDSPIRGDWHGIPGDVYKDVNNGKLYFKRWFNIYTGIENSKSFPILFYMDMTFGKLVCVTDNYKDTALYIQKKEFIDRFIEYFNKEQELGGFIKRNIDNKRTRLEDFYCSEGDFIKIYYDDYVKILKNMNDMNKEG